MKVLFVSSGNNKFGISPIVKAQGESLKKSGIEIEYFTIKGKGFSGYLKNIFKLRRYIKTQQFDLIHSHYFLSSLAATFSKAKKQIVSLMGSDVYTSSLWNFLIRIFAWKWDAIIVKSEKMKEILRRENLHVIPNGVDLETFYEINKQHARQALNWDQEKTYILFAGKPDSTVKNYPLAKKTIELLFDKTELVTLKDIPHKQVVYYLNAADILLMTSIYEGAPNIIKEAMACNCPIVSTDVGDISWVFGNTEGCYLIAFDPTDVAEKIRLALDLSEKIGRIKGRERIIELGLDSISIANNIIDIYKNVINIK